MSAQIEDDEEDYGEDEGDWIIQDSLWEHSADTLAYYYEEGEFIIPGMLPEYDFYAFWDTMHVDAYRFDLRKLQDAIPINILEMDCDFAMPIYGRTNSPFGWRHGRPHTGIDLQLRTGDSVYSAFDGVIRMSKYYNGYGNCVVIRHFNGLETLYGHLSKLEHKPGTLVNAGQLIGLGGSTGHSTGPHLHFEIRFLGRPLNPAAVIDFPNETVKSDTLLIASNLFQMPYTPYYGKKRRGSYRRGRSRSSKR
ncbi:MAG: M23 family metallopeptidase [Bacteroidetes bacterium]|nr:M23 family metallopeptidase [Bacteroidota bacterium]MDA1223648.1 M23 family metallopeptidase [Bacteroidota bacterium]